MKPASERIELRYQNVAENSNKVYILELTALPGDGGYTVGALYGRWPAATAKDIKTKQPVGYAEARSIFDHVLREKLAKGYIVQNSGQPSAQEPAPEAGANALTQPPRKPPQPVPGPVGWKEKFLHSLQPELLTEIQAAEVGQYVADDAYWIQEKRDGRRLIVRKLNGEIFGINKLGQRLFDIDGRLIQALKKVKAQSFLVDGEIEGTKKNGDEPDYWIWDLLEIDGLDLREHDYEARYIGLEPFAGLPFVHILPSFRTEDEKRDALLSFAQKRAEGVVIKDSRAVYAPGRAGQHFKLKFTKSCTCRVKAWNTEISRHTGAPKRSVFVELLDEHGNWIEVGGVSIAQRYNVKIGDLIEVRFLYATAGRRLYQPSFLGKRDDVRPEECTMKQLVYKAGVGESIDGEMAG